MKKWIERALNIHSGDLGRGALLCACLFLVISSYVIGKVAGAALFLSRFQAKQLAYSHRCRDRSICLRRIARQRHVIGVLQPGYEIFDAQLDPGLDALACARKGVLNGGPTGHVVASLVGYFLWQFVGAWIAGELVGFSLGLALQDG